MKHLALLLVLIGAPAVAQATFLDGNELHDRCQTDRAFTTAYILGVHDLHRLEVHTARELNTAHQVPQFHCVPRGVKASQLLDVVCKSIQERPEERHYGAASQVMTALKRAFPCP
jgi:hypothetical protein